MAGQDRERRPSLVRRMTYAGLKSMIYAGLTPTTPASRPHTTTSPSTTASTRTPASARRGCITTTRRSPRRWPCSASRRSSTPRARSTTGGPNWCGTGEAQDAERELGQPRRQLHGRRPEPRHRLRPARPGLRASEIVNCNPPRWGVMKRSPTSRASQMTWPAGGWSHARLPGDAQRVGGHGCLVG